jgi:hypothetical protein
VPARPNRPLGERRHHSPVWARDVCRSHGGDWPAPAQCPTRQPRAGPGRRERRSAREPRGRTRSATADGGRRAQAAAPALQPRPDRPRTARTTRQLLTEGLERAVQAALRERHRMQPAGEVAQLGVGLAESYRRFSRSRRPGASAVRAAEPVSDSILAGRRPGRRAAPAASTPRSGPRLSSPSSPAGRVSASCALPQLAAVDRA